MNEYNKLKAQLEFERNLSDRLVKALEPIAWLYAAELPNDAEKAIAEWKQARGKNNHNCPECDALASYGANDGPCEAHKIDKVKCNSIHPEEINCGWKEFKILSGSINLCKK